MSGDVYYISLMSIKKIIKNKLFPSNGNTNIWDKLQIDDETVSCISLPVDADNISKIMESYCIKNNIETSDLIVTDATAGVGGNTISFSKTFKQVNSIEIDNLRHKYLTNNISAYGINNVNIYCDNCLNLIYKLNHDIIFFDPPWGGRDYRDKSKLKLNVSNDSIESICLKLLDDTHTEYVPKIITLKLPKNYDVECLYRSIKKDNINVILHDLNKMYIIIIHQFFIEESARQ